jgi:hypothetical protein
LFAALTVASIFFFAHNAVEKEAGQIRKPSANVLSGLALTLLLTKLSFVSIMLTEDLFTIILVGLVY